MIDWELINKLIHLVKAEEISGLAVEEKGVKYEVKREMTVAGAPAPVVKAAAHAENKPHPHVEAKQVEEDEGLLAITSPMVGTFYRSPSPEAPAFVEVGADVEPGKTVCIIEAMKLFNEIEAEVRGKVVKILVENGKPVEYGQKLMLIKKA